MIRLRIHINRLPAPLFLWIVFHAVVGQACAETIKSFVNQNCTECHNATDASGGLDLTALPLELDRPENSRQWIRIHDRVNHGEMPPDSQLTDSQRQPFVTALHEMLVSQLSARQQHAGRTILRRLNRREFENSLHDLLGVQTEIAHLLPRDGRAHGFDTVADGLRISAVQMEKYLEVIDMALDDSIRLTERPAAYKKRLRMQDEKEVRKNLDTPEGQVDPNSDTRHRHLFKELTNALVYISHGYCPDHLKQFSPPATGRYRIRASAYSVDPREEPIGLKVFSSNWKTSQLLGYFALKQDQPRTIEFTTRLTIKQHLRFAAFGIGVDAKGKNVWNVDSVTDWKVPGMAIEWIDIEGPLIDQWPPKHMSELFGDDAVQKLKQKGKWTSQGHVAYELAPDDPKAAATKVIFRFAERAFRRPLTKDDADHFIGLAHAELEHGRSYEQAVRVALRAILVSPRFLMLEESPGQLDPYALASRLSYFFWSRPPDDQLLSLAQDGRLVNPKVLNTQVERLLASPRSEAFVTSFVGQWLDVNNIDDTIPDTKLYPEYDELLRDSMVKESQAFFRELLTQNLPITNIISSKFTMLDRRLADHYEVFDSFQAATSPTLHDEQFRRVTLPPNSVRGGVMTQAAVLKVTANGTVTSPVVRGSWILRQIVGKPPSPPPPVNAIEPDTRGATTIRDQLAKHRDSETCNRCHREIDPPGFALESFDVIGGFRERYRSVGEGDPTTKKLNGRNIWEYKLGKPVDCSGQTSDGKSFKGIRDFKQLMLKDKKQIMRCLTEKLVTYSTGAGVSYVDRAEVERIVESVIAQDSCLRTLVHEVVRSPLFLKK